MIEVRGLKKSFGPIDALRGIDLRIVPGAVTGVLGPNACGKTTLIKSILGLVLPDAGEICIVGHPINRDCEYRGQIGYLPQSPDFPSNLSIKELFAMMEDVRGQKAPRREELIALFGLGDFMNKSFAVLSGGTKQKVSATLAFMFDAPILILDEPTVGLDPVAALHLKDLIRKAASGGKCVLMVSHIISEIEQLVSQMIFLLDGKILCSGPVDDILRRTSTDRLDESLVRLMTGKHAR